MRSRQRNRTPKRQTVGQQAAALNAELDKLLAQAQAASEQAGGAAAEAEAFRGKEAIAIAAAADARAEAAAIRAETGRSREIPPHGGAGG